MACGIVSLASATVASNRLSALAASDSSLSAAKAATAAAQTAAGEYSLDTTCTDSRVYFDCVHMAFRKASGGDAYNGTPLGRLIFRLSGAQLLPKHTSNVRMLCTGERMGCAYSYSWCQLEPGPPRLKAHLLVLRGRGRNAYGRSDELIVDDPALRACAHSLVDGGAYYGLEVVPGDWGTNTVLATPVRGAGKGTSRLAILTGLADAPPATRRSLLLDHAVIGVLEPAAAAKAPALWGLGERTGREGLRRDAISAVVEALNKSRNPVKVSSCGEIFLGGQTSAVSCRFVPTPGVSGA